MKTTPFSIAAALAIAISSMSAVHAQDASGWIAANASPDTGRYHVMPFEFADVNQAYRLSNGQVLKLTRTGNHYYAQLDQGKRVRLYAMTDNEFVTSDGAKVIFGDNGDTVGVDNFEKLPMAAKLPPNTTMMMARR